MNRRMFFSSVVALPLAFIEPPDTQNPGVVGLQDAKGVWRHLWFDTKGMLHTSLKSPIPFDDKGTYTYGSNLYE